MKRWRIAASGALGVVLVTACSDSIEREDTPGTSGQPERPPESPTSPTPSGPGGTPTTPATRAPSNPAAPPGPATTAGMPPGAPPAVLGSEGDANTLDREQLFGCKMPGRDGAPADTFGKGGGELVKGPVPQFL